MKVRTTNVMIALMIVATLLLAACGGKSKEASANSGSDAAPAAQVAAEADEVQGDPAQGEKTYQTACVACHGPDANGVTGLGKSLHPAESEFIRGKSDAELVDFIKTGRQPDDPLNTTGVAMPPKGGNPAISDADLHNIVAWLRTLE